MVQRTQRTYAFGKDQLSFGTFQFDHPIFPSSEFIAVRYMDEDKTNKLNLAINHFCEIENCRSPIISDCATGDVKSDAGGAITRLLKKVINTKSN